MIAKKQAVEFAAMALCGVLSAAVYDGLLLLRHALHAGVLLGGAMDLLYGIVPAALMTLAALEMRTDPFRLYMFAAAASGMLLWFGTVGRAGRRMWRLWKICIPKRIKKPENVED